MRRDGTISDLSLRSRLPFYKGYGREFIDTSHRFRMIYRSERQHLQVVFRFVLLLCIGIALAVGPARGQDSQLNLAMTATPDPVSPGGQVTYQITVTNQSAESVQDVYVRSVLPAHTDAKEDNTGGECSGLDGENSFACNAGETIEWFFDDLEAGQSTVVSYTAQVRTGEEAPPDGSALGGNAAVETDEDSIATSADVVVDSEPALSLTMGGSESPVSPEQEQTYTLTYSVPGESSLSGTSLQAAVPSGANFVSATGGGSVSGDQVEWDLGTLQPGEGGHQTFTVEAGSELPDGTLLTSEAEASSGSNSARSQAATAVDTGAPIRLAMTASPDPVSPGGQVTYQITVTNQSAESVQDVYVRSVLPAHTDAKEDNTGGDCDGLDNPFACNAGETIRWFLDDLPAGESAVVSYAAQVRTGEEAPPEGTVLDGNATASSFDGGGASASADVIFGTLDDGGSPTAPTGLTATAAEGQVTLSWDANSDSDLSGYNAYRSTSSFSDLSDATKLNTSLLSDPSYVDMEVTNGTKYFYRVTAVDSDGNESSPSDQTSVIPSSTGFTVRLTNIYVKPENQEDFSSYAPSDVIGVRSGVEFRFEGRVTDESGNPVSEKQVQVYDSFQYAAAEGDDGTRTVTTAENGTFEYPSGGGSIATESTPAGVRPFWFNVAGTNEAVPFVVSVQTEKSTVENINQILASELESGDDIAIDTSRTGPFSDLSFEAQSYPKDDSNLSNSVNDKFFRYYGMTYGGPTDEPFLIGGDSSKGWLKRGRELYNEDVEKAIRNLPERFQDFNLPTPGKQENPTSSISNKNLSVSDSKVALYAGQGALCVSSVAFTGGVAGAVGCKPIAMTLGTEVASLACKKLDDLLKSSQSEVWNCGLVDLASLLIGGAEAALQKAPRTMLEGAEIAADVLDIFLGVIENDGLFDFSNATATHFQDLSGNYKGSGVSGIEVPSAVSTAPSLIDTYLTRPDRPAFDLNAEFDGSENPSALNISLGSNRGIFEQGTTMRTAPSLQVGGKNFSMSPIENGSTKRGTGSENFRYQAEIPVSELPEYTGNPATWNETIQATGISFETLQGTGTGAFCGVEEETLALSSPQSSKLAKRVRTGIMKSNSSTALASTQLIVPSNAFEGSTSFVEFTRVSYSQVARSNQPALRPRSPIAQVKTNRAFTNPASLTLGLEASKYDSDNLNLYWRGESGPWQQVPATINLSDSTATAEVSLSGYYAVMVGGDTPPPPEEPGQVQVLYPTGGTEGIPELPRLSWEGADVATQYRMQLSTHSSFPSDSLREYTASGTSVVPDRLKREMTYYWRVRAENSAGGGPWSDPAQFSTRRASIPFTVTQSFGGAEEAGDYRLVALPGQVERPLGNAISGEAGSEWQVFWDDGSSESYLAEYDGSDTFAFRPGRGFWLTSRQEWSLSDSVKAVPLGSDQATAIPLHDGWNIISNPFGEEVSWNAVSAAHSDSLRALWRFDGSFAEADTFRSARVGEAFYFLNDTGLDSLKVPYPTGSAAKSQAAGKSQEKKSLVTIRARSKNGDGPASAVKVGVDEEAAEGLDRLDEPAPPGRFSELSLRLQAPGEAPPRRRSLMTERRPPKSGPEKGHTFDLRLQATTGVPIQITASGLEENRSAEAKLLRPSTGRSYDLVEGTPVAIEEADSTGLKLAIGSASYVEEQAKQIVPDEVRLTSYPNPTRGQATIEYTLPEAQEVTLEVYDVLGRRVATLENGRRQAGRHTLRLDGGSLPSGVYFGRLEAGEQTRSQKITVVR